MEDETKTCRKCGAEYSPGVYYLGNICRECYRAGERERKAQERSNARKAKRQSCRDCECELTEENRSPGAARLCKSCREKIRAANRAAYLRKIVANSLRSISQEDKDRRDKAQPMGISIYNPQW